jgi:hypothetical protein
MVDHTPYVHSDVGGPSGPAPQLQLAVQLALLLVDEPHEKDP